MEMLGNLEAWVIAGSQLSEFNVLIRAGPFQYNNSYVAITTPLSLTRVI
jgi:hypothetical protein